MRPFLLPATHVIRPWILLGIVATALQGVCGLAPSSSTPWETEADGSQVRNVTLAFGANNEHLHVCYERISPSGEHTGGCTQVMKPPPTIYNYSSGSGVVTTLAGSGSEGSADGTGAAASFNYPNGIAIAPDGSTALVADMDNSRIRSIALATGEVTTLAGGGYSDATGTATYFDLPFSVAIAPDGSSALVTDTNNHLIRSIVLATSVVTTLAGSGSAGFVDGTGAAASFNRPIGIAITPDGSSALVIDHDNNAIRSIALATGVVTTLAGGSEGDDDGTGAAASFSTLNGVAITPDGSLALVTEDYKMRIRAITLATREVTTFAGSTTGGFVDGTGTAARFYHPSGIAISPDGLSALVIEWGNNAIRAISLETGVVTTLAGGSQGFADGTGAAASFNYPKGIAITPDGSTALVADGSNQAIRAVAIPVV